MYRFLWLTVIMLLTLSPQQSNAYCYSCDRSDWARMNESMRVGFVWGVIQTMLVGRAGADNSYVHDLNACIDDLDLRAPDFIDIIENQYEDLELWEVQPDFVLGNGLRSVCLASINRARAARGEAPLQ